MDRLVRWPVILAVAMVVSGPVASAPVALSPHAGVGHGNATQVDADAVRVTYTYFLTPEDPGQIRVAATFRLPDDVSRLEATVPDGSTVAARRGFEAGNGSGIFQWTREDGTDRPRLTYRRPVNEKVGRFAIDLFRYYDAGDWAVSNYFRHDLQFRYWYGGGVDPGWRVDRAVEEGVLGNSMMILGESDVSTREVGSQTLHLVGKRGEPVDDGEVLDTLAYVSDSLRVGDRDGSVYVFTAPTPMHPGTADGEFRDGRDGSIQGDVFVRSDVPIAEGPENTWIHEYVHTRLGFESTRRNAWLNEAIPEYYESFFAYHRFDSVDFRDFRAAVASDEFADANLLAPESWATSEVEYVKGPRVIAALDARIRTATDGGKTFQHVLRRMNDHGGNLSYKAFKGIVGDVAGTDLSGWLDSHVRGSTAPEVPDDPAAYRLGPPAETVPDPGTPTLTATGTATRTAEPTGGLTETATRTDERATATVEDAPTSGDGPARTTTRSASGRTPGETGSGGESGAGASTPGFGVWATLVALAVYALRGAR